MTNERKRCFGISTASLYPMGMKEAFRLLCDIPECEVTEIFVNTLGDASPEKAREVRRMADGSGTPVKSVHPYFSAFEYMLFFSNCAERLDDSIELYRHFFGFAAEVGAEYVVFHGDSDRLLAKNGRDTCAEYYEVFAKVAEAAGKYGIILTQENVAWCKCSTPAFIRGLREAAGGNGIKFTLDTKQAIRAGHDPEEIIGAMGGDIAHVHISDMTDTGAVALPGEGGCDLAGMIRSIGMYNPIVDFVVEVYRENFTVTEKLPEALRHLRSLI